MLDDNAAFKYETPHEIPIEIIQCCTNGIVVLKYGATKIRYNICRIKPNTSDTDIEYIKCSELMIYDFTLGKHRL